MNTKKVLFVRHCESINNEYVSNALDVVDSFINFKVPTLEKLQAAGSLVFYRYDCVITDKGRNQIQDMARILNEKHFWTDHQPSVVIHSPLIRAKETCYGIVAAAPIPYNSLEIIENPDLKEADLFEHVFQGAMNTRIKKFEKWLAALDATTIVVVGHGVYYRQMLYYREPICNCDVIQAIAHYTDNNENDPSMPFSSSSQPLKFKWKSIKLIHRTPLSELSPFARRVSLNAAKLALATKGLQASNSNDILTDTFTNNNTTSHDDARNNTTNSTTSNSTDNNSHTNTNSNTEEKICRICHMSDIETPTMKMIRPCLCSGSLSYVHLKCLNQWRATSSTAQYTCSVCQYEYRIKKSILATFLLDETFIFYVTLGILITSITCIGMLIRYIDMTYIHNIIVHYMYSYTQQLNSTQKCQLLKRTIHDYQLLSPRVLRKIDFFWTKNLWDENIKIIQECLNSITTVFYFVFCKTPYISYITECIVIGVTITGSLGILSCITNDILDIYQRQPQDMNFNNPSIRRLISIFAWWTSSGAMDKGKILIYLGLVFGAREVYTIIHTHSRHIAHSIGEHIMEISPTTTTSTTNNSNNTTNNTTSSRNNGRATTN